MMSEYLEPDGKQDNDQSKKQSTTTPSPDNKIGKNSPKREDFKVLHKDGSLADLPDPKEEGSGALDGTVGLGN